MKEAKRSGFLRLLIVHGFLVSRLKADVRPWRKILR